MTIFRVKVYSGRLMLAKRCVHGDHFWGKGFFKVIIFGENVCLGDRVKIFGEIPFFRPSTMIWYHQALLNNISRGGVKTKISVYL